MIHNGQFRGRQGLGGVVALLVVILSGCGTDTSAPVGPGEASHDQGGAVLPLPADSALAACIRAAAAARGAVLDSAGLAGLTELEASGRGIASLEGIGVLQGLQVLDLSYNRIAELTPLAALGHLHALDLAQNRITAIAALASLSELKGLDLSGNQVSDLTPLAGLTLLETLFLAENQVQDATPLLGLPHLEEVDLTGNPLTAAAREHLTASLSQRGVRVRLAQASASTYGGHTLAYSDESGLHLLEYPGDLTVHLDAVKDAIGGWCWAPDGQSLAVSASLEGSSPPLIYLVNRDGSGLSPLYPWSQDQTLRGQYTPAWSPSGGCLAFMGYEDPFSSRRQVFLEFGTRVVLSAPADAAPGVWSHNGDALAWTGPGGTLQLYWLAFSEEVTACSGFSQVASPSWSPGDEAIVFAALPRGERGSNIYLWQALTGEVTELASDPADSANYFGPAWSPKGAAIAYLTKKGTTTRLRTELRLHQTDGSMVQVIDLHLRWPRALCWSPDGTVLALAASVPGTSKETVYAVDPLSGSIRDLLPAPSLRITGLAWAPQ